jgi:hypothetical protein
MKSGKFVWQFLIFLRAYLKSEEIRAGDSSE